LLDPVSGGPRVLGDPGVVEELLQLASLSSEFLKRMNAITDDYQDVSDERITELLLVEIIVLCFTAAILLVEVIFVVVPSVRHALRTQRILKRSEAGDIKNTKFKLVISKEVVKTGTAEGQRLDISL
jgi:hypothetical protein